MKNMDYYKVQRCDKQRYFIFINSHKTHLKKSKFEKFFTISLIFKMVFETLRQYFLNFNVHIESPRNIIQMTAVM